MIDVRPVAHILGWISGLVGVLLMMPAIADLMVHNRDWVPFAMSGALAVFIGLALVLSTLSSMSLTLDLRQAFLATIFGWLAVSVLGAIPFLSLSIEPVDALFESVSGVTTTGSTVLVGLDTMPPGILLWRAILQWIGGIGIIAVAVLILPLLRVGGMQLFKIESSDISPEKVASALKTIVTLLSVYVILTALCAALFFEFGMNGFDAITHAMATLSTGGYSTHDASFAYFTDLRLHWVATIFMILGALPFVLYIQTIYGRPKALFKDQQVRGFIGFLVVLCVGMAFWLQSVRDISFGQALTLTSFNLTSVVTTTGFATEDYSVWGPGAMAIFLFAMFVGGCSGSTSGAIKVYRFQVVLLVVRAHVKRLFSPNRVIPIHYNGKVLTNDVAMSVLAFLAVFIATIGFVTIILGLLGLDLVTAYTASLTAITNVGPGLGPIVGPAGNFASLPDAAKAVLVVAMLAGRLEVLALLVAFDRDFWRN
ncbi:TrkH family potassium uptake protein [Hwanghaeella sp. LZ110]|uniref:TrkH family potassium uptake protein n=1 Tax=Hwanghaeella sp. LZ110 TaxID=3402810 RepID=UPI003B66B83F